LPEFAERRKIIDRSDEQIEGLSGFMCGSTRRSDGEGICSSKKPSVQFSLLL